MKKHLGKNWILVFAITAAAALIVSGFVIFRHAAGREAVRENMESGNRYLSELNYERAIASYRAALDIDPKNTEAYRRLAEILIIQNKPEEARELLEEALSKTGGKEIEELYQEVSPQPPAASYEEGAYSRRIRVELIPERKTYTVYYTLDGTEPDVNSAVYGEPIILRNGVTVIKAMAVNALGCCSDTAVFEYDCQVPQVEVKLTEPAIEQMVRSLLNIPYSEPVYNEDVEQITQLYIIGSAVRSVADEYSVYLEEKRYSVNANTYILQGQGVLSSLNDLRFMPFLERVVVAYQEGLDISALSECGSVTELSLVGDGLSDKDMKIIGEMSQLEKLNLGWNDIHDISALSELKNLTSLGVWGNRIESIQAVGGMTQLVYLDFSDNEVADIAPVSSLGALQQLWMYRNRVEDIGAVSSLAELQVLMVRDNPLKNPEAVRGVYPHLTRLDVDLLSLGKDRP